MLLVFLAHVAHVFMGMERGGIRCEVGDGYMRDSGKRKLEFWRDVGGGVV